MIEYAGMTQGSLSAESDHDQDKQKIKHCQAVLSGHVAAHIGKGKEKAGKRNK